MVAWTEDGYSDMPASRWKTHRNDEHPAGNYLSIRVTEAVDKPVHVLLAHLEKGSLRVAVGQEVRAGDWIACCGNSGNTTVPHLHIHAQPGMRVAPGMDWGIPIAFAGSQKQEWIKPRAILVGKTAAVITPTCISAITTLYHAPDWKREAVSQADQWELA